LYLAHAAGNARCARSSIGKVVGMILPTPCYAGDTELSRSLPRQNEGVGAGTQSAGLGRFAWLQHPVSDEVTLDDLQLKAFVVVFQLLDCTGNTQPCSATRREGGFSDTHREPH